MPPTTDFAEAGLVLVLAATMLCGCYAPPQKHEISAQRIEALTPKPWVKITWIDERMVRIEDRQTNVVCYVVQAGRYASDASFSCVHLGGADEK